MSDPGHEGAVRARSERLETSFSGSSIRPGKPYLDQLVIVQRAHGLGGDSVGEAGIADLDHGLQPVGEAAQMAALSFGEFHRSIVPAARASELSARGTVENCDGVPPVRLVGTG
jgi:hypothetical protein